MANYILCPRCELNFIDADEQEFCEVCLKELSGAKTFVDTFDDEESAEEMELCPICGENYMRFGEKMCDDCKKKSEYEDDVNDEVETDDPDKADAWRTYLDDEEEEVVDIGIDESEFDDEYEEEEEMETSNDEDEFEYVSADDYYDYDDDDDDDDDEDDDFDDDVAPTPKSSKKKKRKDDDF